jgi:hypothetical protein
LRDGNVRVAPLAKLVMIAEHVDILASDDEQKPFA